MGNKNPKAKGSEWERQVCKRLSLWASNLLNEAVFWRSAMSGGRATFKTRKNRGSESLVSAQAGDLSAISAEGIPFIEEVLVECKNYASLKLDGILYGAAGELRKFWWEPIAQAKQYKKVPLIVIKENNRNPIIMTNEEGSKIFKASRKTGQELQLRAFFPVEDIYVYSLRDLLTDVDYELLCKNLKSRKK